MERKKIRAVTPVETKESAENRTKVIASTNELARDGHVLEPSGLKTANFLRTAAILFDHDSQIPVARPVACSLIDGGDRLEVEVEWPPAGVSARADEIKGLVKAGVIRAASIGFMPMEFEPLDPKEPWGGLHITEADLLEMSFVGVPADTGAIVTQRADGGGDSWKCGASRTLPIQDSDSWDGPAAEASVFAWAGGDDFDAGKARKAFLAYNSAKPKLRGSYKLPIAHVVDGRLQVPKGAIRAAASRLSGTDIPESVKAEAQKVIDHYEEKAGMGKHKNGDGDDGRSAASAAAVGTAAVARAPRVTKEVQGHLENALQHCARGAVHHKAVSNHLDAIDAHAEDARSAHEKARAAHEELGEALESARSEPEKASEHLERAIKAHGQVERAHRAVRAAHNELEGGLEDAAGSHESVGRCMRGAHESIKRAVGKSEGGDHIPGDEDNATTPDADSDMVQTSGGTATSTGSSGGRSMEARRRRVRLLKLAG